MKASRTRSLFLFVFLVCSLTGFAQRRDIDAAGGRMRRMGRNFPNVHEEKTPHKIFTETIWLVSRPDEDVFRNPDGAEVIWRKSIFYEHPKKTWFKSERFVFGELVMKAYGTRGKKGKLVKHWVQIEKDGKWYAARTDCKERGCAELFEMMNLDTSGRLTGVTISLVDKNGMVIVTREVKRKKGPVIVDPAPRPPS